MTHTADQIIEAMARASYDAVPLYDKDKGDYLTWDELSDGTHHLRYDEARAAYAVCLRMLREPTEGQMSVAMAPDFSVPNWRAMIDERIKELG